MFEDIIGKQQITCKAQPADPIVNHLRMQSVRLTSGLAHLPDFKLQHHFISKLLDENIEIKVIANPIVKTKSGIFISVATAYVTFKEFEKLLNRQHRKIMTQIMFYFWTNPGAIHHIEYATITQPDKYELYDKDVLI